MFEIIRLGERTVHDHTFFVDRPKGHFPYGEPISLHQPSEYHSFFQNRTWIGVWTRWQNI